jgi:hypothetical protein
MLTDKQLAYIKVLEQKSKLKFTGTTYKEMNQFVDSAKKVLSDNKIISSKVKREHEKFPFPDLKDDLPSDKQWSFIKYLEFKTKVKFQGVTKQDAMIYIDYASKLLREKC